MRWRWYALITFVTEVSIFALNLTIAMGLALAIDYTLLIVSRFRDELAGDADREEALVRTMTTAGRTVLFSGTTVALSMATLALFPMYFLKSFAYVGVAIVAFAALAAIVVTPAAIVLLGDRLDSLDVRRLGRRLLGRPRAGAPTVRASFWYRCDQVRDGSRRPDRARADRAAAGVRRAIPRREMGLSRRAGVAGLGLGTPGRRRAAQQLRRQLRDRGDRRHPRHVRAHRRRAGPLRRGAVARAGRVIRVGAGRHVRRRRRVGPPTAPDRDAKTAARS